MKKEKKWTRNCPKCGRRLEYKHKKSLRVAEKNNTSCRTCSISGENNPMYGRTHSENTLNKIRENHPKPWLGRKHTKETLQKLSIAQSGENNAMYGRHLSDEHKRKLSIASKMHRMKEIENRFGQIMPNYNPTACKIIDKYGAKHGYNFQHAENGGEVQVLSYFVDGYDKDKNIVIEYYEKHHNRQKDRDEIRQQEIMNHLGCKFVILREKNNAV